MSAQVRKEFRFKLIAEYAKVVPKAVDARIVGDRSCERTVGQTQILADRSETRVAKVKAAYLVCALRKAGQNLIQVFHDNLEEAHSTFEYNSSYNAEPECYRNATVDAPNRPKRLMQRGKAMADYLKVSPEEALAELERVLQSATFEATDRNKRFLKYVVSETLAGRGDRIKAYSIGTSVFGRGDGFDPLQDPIVRIEAGRLRRSLEHHYLLTPSAQGNLRIAIPKGTYVPVFERPHPEPTVAGEPVLHTMAPHLLVKTFDQQSCTATWPDLGRVLTTQVIAALTKFSDLYIYGPPVTARLSNSEDEHAVHIDYKLTGNVTIAKDHILAEFLIQDVNEWRFVWSHSIKRPIDPACDLTELVGVSSTIASEVASIIGQRDGVIDSETRGKACKRHKRFLASQKLVEFQDYWRKVDLPRNEPLRRDLEKVIAADPDFAGAHACLSLLYTDADRYGIDCGPDYPRPIERALALAGRAVELAPRSGRCHHALGVAKWFSGQPEPALQELKTASSLNPNDSEFLAEFGLRSAMRMQWEAGIPMLIASFERNPLQSGQYRMGLFFFYFASGDYEEALRQALLAEAPMVAHPNIACAAALSRLGRHAEASRHLAEAEAIAPGLFSRLAADLAKRQIHPDLIEMVIGSFDWMNRDANPLDKRKLSHLQR
jgi:tetratricopeptide (TPR) repeat protein/TolB-like protein